MTSTELGYLSGVTSNIQDQLNEKVSKGYYGIGGEADVWITSVEGMDDARNNGWYQVRASGSYITINGSKYWFNYGAFRVDKFSGFVYQTLYPAYSSFVFWRHSISDTAFSDWKFSVVGNVTNIYYGNSTSEYDAVYGKHPGCLMFVKSS